MLSTVSRLLKQGCPEWGLWAKDGPPDVPSAKPKEIKKSSKNVYVSVFVRHKYRLLSNE